MIGPALRRHHEARIPLSQIRLGQPGRQVLQLRGVVAASFTRPVQEQHQWVTFAWLERRWPQEPIMKRQWLAFGYNLDSPVFIAHQFLLNCRHGPRSGNHCRRRQQHAHERPSPQHSLFVSHRLLLGLSPQLPCRCQLTLPG